jgi:hypothetical protein
LSPQVRYDRSSIDFVADQFIGERCMRNVVVADDCTRETLLPIPRSLAFGSPARLARLIGECGKPKSNVSNNLGAELAPNTILQWG